MENNPVKQDAEILCKNALNTQAYNHLMAANLISESSVLKALEGLNIASLQDIDVLCQEDLQHLIVTCLKNEVVLEKLPEDEGFKKWFISKYIEELLHNKLDIEHIIGKPLSSFNCDALFKEIIAKKNSFKTEAPIATSASLFISKLEYQKALEVCNHYDYINFSNKQEISPENNTVAFWTGLKENDFIKASVSFIDRIKKEDVFKIMSISNKEQKQKDVSTHLLNFILKKEADKEGFSFVVTLISNKANGTFSMKANAVFEEFIPLKEMSVKYEVLKED